MEKVQATQENNNLLKNKKEKKSKSGYKPIWIIISFAILLIILLLPTPAGLPIMAKGALAILAFAVIMWVMEKVLGTLEMALEERNKKKWHFS